MGILGPNQSDFTNVHSDLSLHHPYIYRIGHFSPYNLFDIFSVYKECFFFIAKRGYTTDERELGTIMQSLSLSPTTEEIHQYFQKHVKGG